MRSVTLASIKCSRIVPVALHAGKPPELQE